MCLVRHSLRNNSYLRKSDHLSVHYYTGVLVLHYADFARVLHISEREKQYSQACDAASLSHAIGWPAGAAANMRRAILADGTE